MDTSLVFQQAEYADAIWCEMAVLKIEQDIWSELGD